MDKVTLGAMLRQVRKNAGKTQAAMALALKASQTTISDWETGTNEAPIAMLDAWAAACGVGVQLVFGSPGTTADTPRLLAAWQQLSADEREDYLDIIEKRAKRSKEKA